IRYKQTFENITRRVFLQGTAFFHPVRDRERPFIVEAEGFATTALGASFRVYAQPGTGNLRVALFTGKVSVGSVKADAGKAGGKRDFRPIILEPGKQVTIRLADLAVQLESIHDGIAADKGASPEKAAAGSGDLEFSRTPLAAIFERLQLEYDV